MRITSVIRFSLITVLLLLNMQHVHGAQQRAPLPDDKPMAMVFGATISSADVMPNEEERDAIKQQVKDNYAQMLDYVIRVNASNKIYERVIEGYASQKGIVLNEDLVDKFIETFSSQMTDETSTKSIHEIAVKQVMQYQTEKAMFEEFGGRVIFLQSNPMMPIDAYHALLSRYRDNGDLKIIDKTLSETFWEVFEPPFQFEISPENIDFGQPWWL
ncbi:hypothetical protein [Alteromonas gracilis]|uniref:hypothetical protein n=1 Tax=Alteromonas gracilis TaxID=1479524 RepID=UPI003735E91B